MGDSEQQATRLDVAADQLPASPEADSLSRYDKHPAHKCGVDAGSLEQLLPTPTVT
ncbi:hypothetical protein VTN00DRAFT_9073 [Thermoascus crustaceus]|uniref:uncharacterized protein n=1 Tax=Thermoascus crustaceus TaxID=5088 RepID=UPI0037437D56